MSDALERSMDLQVRSDGRTVYGIVMPYNVETRVNDGAGPYIEVFRKGAYAKTVQERSDKVRLVVNHDKHGQLPVGRSEVLREDAAGLYGEFRVSTTPAADEVLALARDGAVDFSAGFIPIIPSANAPIPTSGIVERTEAKLDHVAVVGFPAYEGARIMGVRSELDPEEFDPEVIAHELSRLLRSVPVGHPLRQELRTFVRQSTHLPICHLEDVTSDEAAERTSDEADEQETKEPSTEAASRTSAGHSDPHQPAQRPTLTPERLREDLARVTAMAAAASTRSA